jgi:hypothetical protein
MRDSRLDFEVIVAELGVTWIEKRAKDLLRTRLAAIADKG